VLSPAIGAFEALAQANAFELPKATEGVEPFKVSVPQSAIDDLKRRLTSTRWPERETVGDWSQGVPLLKAEALVNEVDRGGHFAAFEQPKLFTEELRKAFRSRRD